MIRSVGILLVIFTSAAMARPQSATYVRRPPPPYTPPTRSALFHDFLLDSVGPYPIVMALATAGIHQATDNPPEWRQGTAAFSQRFGSNMGITAVGNATRLGLGDLLHQDTSYYRCRCSGIWPRLRHAAVSAVLARKYSNGEPVFSVGGFVAPYAATLTAVNAWYPARYSAKDAFRMGNYNLLGTVGSNITFEFLPAKVRKLMDRVHFSSRRVADEP